MIFLEVCIMCNYFSFLLCRIYTCHRRYLKSSSRFCVIELLIFFFCSFVLRCLISLGFMLFFFFCCKIHWRVSVILDSIFLSYLFYCNMNFLLYFTWRFLIFLTLCRSFSMCFFFLLYFSDFFYLFFTVLPFLNFFPYMENFYIVLSLYNVLILIANLVVIWLYFLLKHFV